jgi:hypothetical protein
LNKFCLDAFSPSEKINPILFPYSDFQYMIHAVESDLLRSIAEAAVVIE